MIVLRQGLYSRNRIMIDRVTKKLDNAGLDDYDIDSRIPSDTISVSSDRGNLKIYLPYNSEYFKYDIDDFIRGLSSVLRTKSVLDGDVYVISVYGGRLTEDQYFKLLRFIIEEEEFVTILEEENR